jgi:hypothetical protein
MATKTSKLLFQVGNQSEKLWALKKYHGTTIHEFGLNACCAAFKFNSKLGNPTSRNPTIFNIMCWVAGSMGDHLINQVTDVPSIIFFHNFLQNSLQKKSFECSKSKPATHCFFFNLSK